MKLPPVVFPVADLGGGMKVISTRVPERLPEVYTALVDQVYDLATDMPQVASQFGPIVFDLREQPARRGARASFTSDGDAQIWLFERSIAKANNGRCHAEILDHEWGHALYHRLRKRFGSEGAERYTATTLKWVLDLEGEAEAVLPDVIGAWLNSRLATRNYSEMVAELFAFGKKTGDVRALDAVDGLRAWLDVKG